MGRDKPVSGRVPNLGMRRDGTRNGWVESKMSTRNRWDDSGTGRKPCGTLRDWDPKSCLESVPIYPWFTSLIAFTAEYSVNPRKRLSITNNRLLYIRLDKHNVANSAKERKQL